MAMYSNKSEKGKAIIHKYNRYVGQGHGKTRAVTRQWQMPPNHFFIKIPTSLLADFLQCTSIFTVYIN